MHSSGRPTVLAARDVCSASASQLKTLLLSMVFTSCLGAAGFFTLKSFGMFSSNTADLPSAREVARLIRTPKVAAAWLLLLLAARRWRSSTLNPKPKTPALPACSLNRPVGHRLPLAGIFR